jgi:hypothetical protein
MYAKRMGFDCSLTTRALSSAVQVPLLMMYVRVNGCDVEHRKNLRRFLNLLFEEEEEEVLRIRA